MVHDWRLEIGTYSLVANSIYLISNQLRPRYTFKPPISPKKFNQEFVGACVANFTTAVPVHTRSIKKVTVQALFSYCPKKAPHQKTLQSALLGSLKHSSFLPFFGNACTQEDLKKVDEHLQVIRLCRNSIKMASKDGF